MLATPEDVMVGTMSFASLIDAVTEAMELWSNIFFLNGDSAVKIQQIFHKHFNISRHGKVPCHNAIWYIP
jgi:hypothetical protein